MQRRELLNELEELFGTRIEAQGRAFAERRRQDEELFEETLRRFARGRAKGRFPALDECLRDASDEATEAFFKEEWMSEVLHDEPAEKPWDSAPWCGNREAYREDLYSGMALGHPDLRAFAQEWLDELAGVGYHGMEEVSGLPLKQQAGDLSVMPHPLPVHGDVYPVRFQDAGQTIWLRLDGPRSPERGYREVLVSDDPLRTDTAILAALTSLEGRRLDVGRLRETLPEFVPFSGESFFDRWKSGLGEGQEETLRNLRHHHRALDYVLTLLRYHRPGFDDLPVGERAGLIADASAHVNRLLETLRKLSTFLEHGRPGRRGPTAARVTARDVTAAVLKDVDGLTHKEIGERFGILFPVDFGHKGDHATVRKMVLRGRRVLEQALGADGWRTQAEAMRAEAEHWHSLSEDEREAELEAEALGIPRGEAQRCLLGERRRHENPSEDEPGIA